MRFEVGQQFASKPDGTRIAIVVQTDDDGLIARIDVRDTSGELLDRASVNYTQFSEHWVLLAPAT